MFQKGHGQKNFFVVRTVKGYYAAKIAGLESFTNKPENAHLFYNSEDAVNFYERALKRPIGKNLPKSYTVGKFRISGVGADKNR